jgi:hypothetical protein
MVIVREPLGRPKPGDPRCSFAVRFVLPIAALSISCAVAAQACSIPVFRYALDRWPADRFSLEVSPADARDEQVAKFLRNLTDSTPLNLTPLRLKEDGASRLTFPHPEPGAAEAWRGALDGATLAQIVDSPARAEIVRRTLAGESAVWVLVESGDRAAGDRAATALEQRLSYLEQASLLPPIDPNDPTSKLGPGPKLGIKFSLVRIRHDDSAERAFVKMLAGPKADAALQNGPWLSVIFGRGRALGAWPAEGFGDEQIDEVCGFLLGACSCEVKRLNPGWDLLVKADWDAELATAEQARISASDNPDALPAPSVVPETVTFEPRVGSADVADTIDQRRLTLRLLLASFGFVAVVSVLGKFFAAR